MTTRNQFLRGLLASASLGTFWTANRLFAYGPWLEKTPIGGAELSSGLDRAALESLLNRIEAETAGRPFLVTRTKWLVALFDNIRLAANPEDPFVHWHPDGMLLPSRYIQRLDVLKKRTHPAAAYGWSTVDVSHTCPDWKSILALGPRGLADRARRRRETAETDDERLFLDCVAEVYDALCRECVRWAEFADAQGMKDVAAVLREIAVHEPRTFREALQWALVYDRAQETEGEDVRSQGIFDRLFIRSYRADIAAGRETRESAKKLIAGWFTCFWKQQHENNKNIALGGYDVTGKPIWNELTELAFEVFDELGRINPKLTYRFGAKTPREQLEKVTRCVANGHNSIVFACEETLGETFRRRGKTAADIADYVLIGCYEPGIQGREVIASMSTCVNLAAPIPEILSRPADSLPRNGDEFEKAYLDSLLAGIDRLLVRTRTMENQWPEVNPSPLFSGAFESCVAKAADVSRGGCAYNQSGVVLMGIGTAADSLAAVRYLVDEQKLVTMAELAEVLKGDWGGREELRLKARRLAPKWGNNDDRADLPIKRVYDAVCAKVNAACNGHGGTFQVGSWSINHDISCGRWTTATPDGRKAKEPLSRNNAATDGCGKEGATALMLSNLKFDQAECPDGHIMDVLLPASLAKGDHGVRDIADLIATYFAKGGQCLHLNCLDAKTLRNAQANPDRYSDLQIRVCGWNVRWNDLSKVEQDHFIATAEAQEN